MKIGVYSKPGPRGGSTRVWFLFENGERAFLFDKSDVVPNRISWTQISGKLYLHRPLPGGKSYAVINRQKDRGGASEWQAMIRCHPEMGFVPLVSRSTKVNIVRTTLKGINALEINCADICPADRKLPRGYRDVEPLYNPDKNPSGPVRVVVRAPAVPHPQGNVTADLKAALELLNGALKGVPGAKPFVAEDGRVRVKIITETEI